MSLVQRPGVGIGLRAFLPLSERIVLFCNIQAAENEEWFNAKRGELGQVVFEVWLEAKRETTKRGDKWFLYVGVIEHAVLEIVGGFDSDSLAAQLLQV